VGIAPALPVGPLNRVLLHEHPAVAGLHERAHERVRHVRVVGQRQLRRREAARPPQPRDQLAHPPIAPAKHRGVVVLPDVRVLEHVLQVADKRCGAQILPAGRNQRPMHVQPDRARAPDPRDRIAAVMPTGQWAPLTSSQRLRDELLGSGHVRDSIDRVGQLHRCRALAAWRLHACASHSRRRLGIPDPGAPTSGPRASR
jgi:hypothetical protein